MPDKPTVTTRRQPRTWTPCCCVPITEAPLRETDAAELAGVFAALGDPVRLRLLSIVAAEGEVCSCNLEGPLGKSQPTISHHTRVLAEAGLIVGEKRGRWMWWRVVPEQVERLRGLLGGSDSAPRRAERGGVALVRTRRRRGGELIGQGARRAGERAVAALGQRHRAAELGAGEGDADERAVAREHDGGDDGRARGRRRRRRVRPPSRRPR